MIHFVYCCLIVFAFLLGFGYGWLRACELATGRDVKR